MRRGISERCYSFYTQSTIGALSFIWGNRLAAGFWGLFQEVFERLQRFRFLPAAQLLNCSLADRLIGIIFNDAGEYSNRSRFRGPADRAHDRPTDLDIIRVARIDLFQNRKSTLVAARSTDRGNGFAA